MSIRRVTSPEVAEATPGLWSNCLVVDRIAYVSGMTARDRNFQPAKDADEYVQAKIIFGKIRALVEAAGGAMADIVKLTIFVTNIANREKKKILRAACEVMGLVFGRDLKIDFAHA